MGIYFGVPYGQAVKPKPAGRPVGSRWGGYRKRPDPPEPTAARPGSLEKIDVMRDRWAAGYHLHHPDDFVFPAAAEMVNLLRYLEGCDDDGVTAAGTNGAHHKNGRKR